MKRLAILFLLTSFYSGCASMFFNPKEDLRNIFLAVKAGDFKAAYAQINSEPRDNFSTYKKVVIPRHDDGYDSVYSLVQHTEEVVQGCQKLIEDTALLNAEAGREDINVEASIDGQRQTFKEGCTNSGLNTGDLIEKIKGYSSVDLSSLLDKLNDQFQVAITKKEKEYAANRAKLNKQINVQEQAKQKYEQSPAYYSKKMCEVLNIIKLAKTQIAQENEAGQISGYVNKDRLYRDGQAITENRRILATVKAEYRQKFGMSWHESQCK